MERLHFLGISVVSDRTGTPTGAVAASMISTLVLLPAFGLAGTTALNAFFYLATIGTLCVLVLYVLVSVSALRLRSPGGEVRSRLGMILPIGGAAVALYVLYRTLVPAPAFPYNLFPYIVAGWIALGITLAFTVPEVRRVSEGLASG